MIRPLTRKPRWTIRIVNDRAPSHTLHPREVDAAEWNAVGDFTMQLRTDAVRRRTLKALKAMRPARDRVEVRDPEGLVATYDIMKWSYHAADHRLVITAEKDGVQRQMQRLATWGNP